MNEFVDLINNYNSILMRNEMIKYSRMCEKIWMNATKNEYKRKRFWS